METERRDRPYNQVARAQAQQRTRDALLVAAESEFLAGGWEHASLEAMAAKAGVTKQTLLRHFGSKEDLLEQTVTRGYERVRDQRWVAPSDDVAGAVDNLLDHYEEWGERSMRMSTVVARSDALADIAGQARRLHYDWVEHAFGPRLDSLGEPARARCRAALIAICDVHSWWLFSHDLGLTRDEVRATLIQAIERLTEEQE